MYCNNCGKEIIGKSKFCKFCGTSLLEEELIVNPKVNSTHNSFSKNMFIDNEGVYRWAYGMNMFKNPTIMITLWKVFFIGGMFPVLIVTVLELFEQGIGDAISVFIPMFLGMIGVITALVIVSYPIVAITNGGIYQVVFEMNDLGVYHIQMDKQFKKNQVIAMITTLVGAVAGSPKTTGAGLLASSKQSSYSEFSKVNKIVTKASRHVIYINEGLEHNQVYVSKEDFEQVKNFVIEHCEAATVIDK